ncbi:MAG: hypothetical protein CVV64_17615 [Candidatus Wallbacteria bacterium HGW-Wallbacteria-1]|jgi:hypothetical protein|uniref:Cyclic nucleotide-binding domain-containing protein n=1 Tax=Candidatus Wallbacteria bacterium HGW-Wallbacteria-1 TaxID=2013854 RepID=A0A2N1PK68_9BACT|nr:MAG: hypothetical protein CVV64_17615 [Candidatus Wallbacteria bacterium HGW-Wallbacteria-1]
MKNIRIRAWFIIFFVLSITVLLLSEAGKVGFSGSVADLIITETDAETSSSDKTNSEHLVVMVQIVSPEKNTSPDKKADFINPSRLLDLKEICLSLEKTELFSSVTSIAGISLPRSSPAETIAMEYKQRHGLTHALLKAEKIYRFAPRELPKELIFQKGKRPVFPVFKNQSMKSAMEFIDHFSVWENLPGTTHEARLFMNDISNPVYLKNFISGDMRACAILLSLKSTSHALENLPAIRKTIDKISENYKDLYTIVLAGNLLLQDEMKETISTDTIIFLKLGFILILICYGWAYRTPRGVILPLITLIISEIWVLGIMGLTGHDLNIVLYIVPVFVLAVGSSATIHMISKFYAFHDAGMSLESASINSARELLLPIGSASLTTAFGFGALTISNVQGLNTFVILCIAGLAIITFLSIIFIPALNIVLPPPRRKGNHDFISTRHWSAFSDWVFSRSALISLLFMITGSIAALGIYLIDTDNDLTKLLKKDSKVLKTADMVSRKLAGTTILTINMESNPGWCIKRESLDNLSKLQKELEKSPNIDKSTSLGDLLRLTHSLATPDNQENRPANQYEINSHLHLFRAMETSKTYSEFGLAIKDLMQEFVSSDFSTARIQIRSNLTSLKLMNSELARINNLVSKIMGSHIKVTISGGIIDVNRAVERILLGQTKGVILSLFTIFILMLIYFFSLKISILSIIPNVFPILFFYGSLGLFNIGLDLSSGLVACVAIGISVDDTIHFMTEMRRQLKGTYNSREAIFQSHQKVGGPMILTSLILAIFFGILILSKFPVMSNLGWLMAGTMLLAMISNILLLPALLARVRLFGVWDMLKKYNFNPADSPLFAGMSKLGTRTFLSMGRVASFANGETIFTGNEKPNAIHIIIEGHARIILCSKHNNENFTDKLTAGQAFGEITAMNPQNSIFQKDYSNKSSLTTPETHQQIARYPAIIAESEMKTIVIDGDFFEIAGTFSPKICNRFLMNLLGSRDKFLLLSRCGSETEGLT